MIDDIHTPFRMLSNAQDSVTDSNTKVQTSPRKARRGATRRRATSRLSIFYSLSRQHELLFHDLVQVQIRHHDFARVESVEDMAV